ncbi:MAG: hypothetical protein U9R26_07065 [Campylobacterota bacterium]|nr:hypothetical protein [Campylobacterota bacterium]
MDKIQKNGLENKMRKGVVLFITLSVIAAMLVLVGAIFTYLEKSRDNASYTSAIIQADLIFRDSKDVIGALLKSGAKDKEIKKTILDTLYLAPVTIEAEGDDEMFITLDCQPLGKGVNINWLGFENNSSAQLFYDTAQSAFDRLVEQYNIQDASLLLSRIRVAIDGEENSGAQPQGRLEQKKGIIKLSQIQNIARAYRFEADDDAVENIAWDRYFSFDVPSMVMDGNYFSAELVSMLFDMELESVKEEWFEGDDLKAFVSTNGGDMSQYNTNLFASEMIERMGCRVTYGYQGNVYALGFDYLEGRADKFEFFGKQ